MKEKKRQWKESVSRRRDGRKESVPMSLKERMPEGAMGRKRYERKKIQWEENMLRRPERRKESGL